MVFPPPNVETLSVIACRYPGMQNNSLLLGFLKLVSDSYQSKREAKRFVLNLLRLNIGKIRSPKNQLSQQHGKESEDTFESFLKAFLTKNHLQEILLQDAELILVSYFFVQMVNI